MIWKFLSDGFFNLALLAIGDISRNYRWFTHSSRLTVFGWLMGAMAYCDRRCGRQRF